MSVEAAKRIGIILLILAFVSPMINVYASTIYPYVIIPPPQLYSLISSSRVLIGYGDLSDSIIESKNITLDENTSLITLNNGEMRVSYPQPRPLIIINTLGGENNTSSTSLTVKLVFSQNPSLWKIYVNSTGGNTVTYIRGIDNVSGREYLTDMLTLSGRTERIEVGFIPGVVFAYIKTSNDNYIFYYPLPDNTLLEDVTIKGTGVISGKIYSATLLSKGSKIIIPALEQEDIGGITYHITKSSDAYIVLLPYRVTIEFARPPTEEQPTYRKRLVSVIDFPYATGILNAYIQPSINGTLVSVNASFYHLVNLDKLIDELYYYVKYFILQYDVKGTLTINNTTTTYYLGSYIMKLSKGKENLTIPVPEGFDEYEVNVSLYVPGILYGNLYNATRVNIGTIILDSSLIPETNLAINNPYIRGNVKLSLVELKKPTYTNPCGESSCNETIYNRAIIAATSISYMADVESYLDKYYPYLLHYYLVTRVIVNGNVYSYEKPVIGNKSLYEFQVPLSNSYTILFSLKAPAIVVEEGKLRETVEENISAYNISLVTLEPKVVVNLPSIVNLVLDRIPETTRMSIPVRVYWLPGEKTLLMTPVVYKVYLIDPLTNESDLIYAFTSQWLSDTTLEVDVPITSIYQDLLVEVKYLLGDQWMTASKKVVLNATVRPPETTPALTNTSTPTYNATPTTITVTRNCTNITLTSTIYRANTTIISTVYLASTTIISLSTITTTKTYVSTIVNTTTATTTTTTTSVKPVEVFVTVTSTRIPELPALLITPPYSHGIGVLLAVIVAAISLRYLSRITGRRKR